MFDSILNSTTSTLSVINAVIIVLVALGLGFIIALAHMLNDRYSKNFIVTLVLLPVLISAIIILVNGNLGTSVAILGAFSLIRFRSMPGTSREILSVILAMAVGLATGMGYITFAVFFTIISALIIVLLTKTKFAEKNDNMKILRIIIPEDLDYPNVFDEVFEKHLNKYELDKVKTTNLGSLYELTYRIDLKKDTNEKELIDDIRIRNGNLNIILNKQPKESMEL